MKKDTKKRRPRIVPRLVFFTVCVGVVPASLASCGPGPASVAASCFQLGTCPDAGAADGGNRDGG